MSFGDEERGLEGMEQEVQRTDGEISSESENEIMEIMEIREIKEIRQMEDSVNEIDMSEGEEGSKNESEKGVLDEKMEEVEEQEISMINENGRGNLDDTVIFSSDSRLCNLDFQHTGILNEDLDDTITDADTVMLNCSNMSRDTMILDTSGSEVGCLGSRTSESAQEYEEDSENNDYREKEWIGNRRNSKDRERENRREMCKERDQYDSDVGNNILSVKKLRTRDVSKKGEKNQKMNIGDREM